MCPECEKAKKEAQKAKKLQEQEAVEEEKIKTSYAKANISKRFLNCTIENYRPTNNNEVEIKAIIYNYANSFTLDTKNGLILFGNVGTGKTHLAISILKALIRKYMNSNFYYLTYSELMRDIRMSKSFTADFTEMQLINKYGNARLLIIDDIGVSDANSESEKRAIYDIVDLRYRNELPTIMISNLQPKEFKEVVGDRIVDRVKADGGLILTFTGESKRKAS